jgi:hypothetical protein
MGERLEVIISASDAASAILKDVKQNLSGVNLAAIAIGGAAVAGVAALTRGLWDAAQAAAEEEIGMTKLATAVDASGVAWADVGDEVEAYIAAAQRRTAFDDSVQRQSLTNLTTATGDYKQAMSLLPLAMDMARAKGMDLVTASDLVGKVAMGNTGILSRYGIVLGENATAQEALAAMQQRFAGQADAYGNTVAGKTELMRQQFDNLKETIGAAVLPVLLSLFTFLSDLAGAAIPMVEQALSFLKEHMDIIIPVIVAMGAALAVQVIPAVIGLASSLLAMLPVMAASGAAILAVIGPVIAVGAAVAALAIAWNNDWGGIQTKTLAALSAIQGIIEQGLTAVRGFVEQALSTMRGWWQEHGDAIMDIVRAAWAVIQNIIDTATGVIQGLIRAWTALLRGDFREAWDAILGIIRTVWEGIENHIRLATELVRMIVGTAWNTILNAARAAWDNIKEAIGEKWEDIKRIINQKLDNIRGIITGFSLVDAGKALIQGLIDGVGAMGGALADAAGSLARRAIQAIKDALGIHSPSAAFMDIGEQTGLGLVIGLENTMPAMVDEGRRLAQAVVAGYSEYMHDQPFVALPDVPLVGRPGQWTAPGRTWTRPYEWIDDSDREPFVPPPLIEEPPMTRPGVGGGGGRGGGGGASGEIIVARFGEDAVSQLDALMRGTDVLSLTRSLELTARLRSAT